MKKWSRILAGLAVAIVVAAAVFAARAQTRGATDERTRRAAQEAPQKNPRDARGPREGFRDYDLNVPGFDVRRYTKFFRDMPVEYPRQISPDDEKDLVRIGGRFLQMYHQTQQAKLGAFRQLANIMMGLIEYATKWDNAFVAEYDGNEVVSFAGPKGERFLAGLEAQPFVFVFRVKDSDKMYVLKTKHVDLEGWDGVRLTVDPEYPTIFKLFISGIQEGTHSYHFKLRTPEGELFHETRFDLRGVKPGHIKVEFIDEDTGRPTETLLGLFPSNGRDLPPRQVPFYLMQGETYVRRASSGLHRVKDARVSIVKGGFEMPVYPGPCRIVATKGPEYLVLDETFEVPSGGIVAKTFTMKRFVDLRKSGWYSGDDHCHVGRDPSRDADIMALLSAVDLRVTNIVQMGDENSLYYLQAKWGDMSRYWYGDRVMMTGQEDPRTTWRGHTLMYNIQNTIHDRNTYYLYEDVFKEARRQGGLTGYAHSAKAFKGELGASVSVPLNLIDFFEVSGVSGSAVDVAYHFWNLGFKVSVFNGADFPYGQIPGTRRFFAHVDGELTVEKYLDSLKAGHTFTSQGGAFIDVRINGKLPGSTIEAKAGEQLKVTVKAAVNPDYGALGRVELVKHGKVIKSFEPENARDATLEYETTLEVDKSCWIAGRVFGKRAGATGTRGVASNSGGYTSPFYIIVDGKPFWDEENLEAELARANKSLDEFTELAKQPTKLKMKQRDRLLDYIEEARQVYRAMEAGKAPAIE